MPTVLNVSYVQDNHLDLAFYRFFKPWPYLRPHAEQLECWHGGPDRD